MSEKTIIIIGAGVTGLSTAYHLARMGHTRVVILEKDGIGAGSSSRAAGITTGLLWTEAGIHARKYATRFFREFSATLPGYTYHNEHGCLNLFSPELWSGRAELLPLYDRLGVPYQVLSAAEMRRRWPGLTPPNDFTGLHDPLGGYSEPPEYLQALANGVRKLGVQIRENVRVDEICVERGRVIGVKTGEGRIAADYVVATTYSWILPLLNSIGLSLPVKTFVHQRYVSEPMDSPIQLPPLNADPYIGYIRPAKGNRLLLGIETPDRDDYRVPSLSFRLDGLQESPGILELAVGRFREVLPTIDDLKWETKHVGLLSFSMDGEPILGPVSSVENLFVGNCFHSGGFSYSPASGYFLAEYVTHGKTSIDLTAFSPARFTAADAEQYLASTITQRHAVRRRH